MPNRPELGGLALASCTHISMIMHCFIIFDNWAGHGNLNWCKKIIVAFRRYSTDLKHTKYDLPYLFYK